MPGSPQWSPSFKFTHKNPVHASAHPIRATCPAYLILLDFITETILVEEYLCYEILADKAPHRDIRFKHKHISSVDYVVVTVL
jgi:hypothetical protein